MLLRSLQINGNGEGYLAYVSDFIIDGRWEISGEFAEAFPDIADHIKQVPLPLREVEDTLIWPFSSTGDLSFRDAYDFLRPSAPVPWARHLWGPHIPPRISTFVWRLLHGRLATHNLLQLYDRSMATRCPICENSSETIEHLFLSCPFAFET